jgi:hypothetical protein
MKILLLYHKNNMAIPQDMSSQFMSYHIWGARNSTCFSTCKPIFIHTSSLLLTNWLLFLAPLLRSHRFLNCFNCTVRVKGKVHPCTGTEGLCRPYGP